MSMAKRKKAKPRRRKASAYEESRFKLQMPAIVRDNPADSTGLFLIAAAAAAVVVNALLLQGPVKPFASVTPIPRPAVSGTAATPVVGTTTAAETPNMLVREVQAELARRGLYDGPADGLFGPKTEAAILDFEIGAGLKPTGQPNPALLAAMRGASPSIVPSSQVATVQRVLDQKGFGPIKADGILGEGTRTAIRRFEASRGLPQRGDISPALLAELSKVSGVKFN